MCLADKVFDAATVAAIVKGAPEAPLEPRERAMMAFVEKLVLQRGSASPPPTSRHSGLTGTGTRRSSIWPRRQPPRCFFSKLLDALGVQPDSSFNDAGALPAGADGWPALSPRQPGARLTERE